MDLNNLLDIGALIFAIIAIPYWLSRYGWPKNSKRKSYSISEDGKWLWASVQDVPSKISIEDGDYRELATGGYQKRIANTWFNRNRQGLESSCEPVALLVGSLVPSVLIIFIGMQLGWPGVIYMSLATGVLLFLLYFLSKKHS